VLIGKKEKTKKFLGLLRSVHRNGAQVASQRCPILHRDESTLSLFFLQTYPKVHENQVFCGSFFNKPLVPPWCEIAL
jgi:hypothetical protein